MKMRECIYAELDTLVSEVIKGYSHEAWKTYADNLRYDPDVKNIHTRLTWDIYYMIPMGKRFPWTEKATLYGLKMPHIETALQRIVGTHLPGIALLDGTANTDEGKR